MNKQKKLTRYCDVYGCIEPVYRDSNFCAEHLGRIAAEEAAEQYDDKKIKKLEQKPRGGREWLNELSR